MPSSSEDHKLRVNIRNRDLLCVNGCGFYGTPQWENRCSKCWQLLQNTQKRNDDYLKNKMAFRQFEERRKLSTESRSLTIKNLLKKSPSLVSGPDGTSSSSSSSQHVSASAAFHASASAGQLAAGSSSPVNRPRTRQRSPESQMARDDLSSFLSRNVPPTIAATISKSLSQLTVNIYEPRMTPEDLSAAVQAYYSQLDAYLNSQSIFIQNKLSIRAVDVMESVERYICTACYQRLFWADSEEEVADLSLQERIRSLHWVTFGFLDTRLDLSKEQARIRLDEAINEMIDVNSHRRVEEKLQCLLRCSHKIFDSLRESGAPTSADEFLPALIYVLLKGNPPLIQSNVNFISRFALPSRTMSGEPAYFFTNVSGALLFVQNINHESLKMSRDEFESYTSGELAPPLNKGSCGCNQALSSMESSLARMTKLIDEQKQLSSRIDEFERQVSQEESSLCDRIRELMSSCPSPEWIGLRDKVARAEAAATDACSLNSTGSSARTSTDSAESSASKQPVDLLQ